MHCRVCLMLLHVLYCTIRFLCCLYQAAVRCCSVLYTRVPVLPINQAAVRCCTVRVAVLPISGCCTVLSCNVQSGSCAVYIRLQYGAVLYCTIGQLCCLYQAAVRRTVLFCTVHSGSCAAYIRLLYGAVLYCTLGQLCCLYKAAVRCCSVLYTRVAVLPISGCALRCCSVLYTRVAVLPLSG